MFQRFDLNTLDPLVVPQRGDRLPPPVKLVRKPAPVAQRDGFRVRKTLDGLLFTTMGKDGEVSPPQNAGMHERDGDAPAPSAANPLGMPQSCRLETSAGQLPPEAFLMREKAFVQQPEPMALLAEGVMQLNADKVKLKDDELVTATQLKEAVRGLTYRLAEHESKLYSLRREWKPHLPKMGNGPGMYYQDSYCPYDDLRYSCQLIEVRLADGNVIYGMTHYGVNWGYDPGGRHVVAWRYCS